MIGTSLIESLVHCVTISHKIAHYRRLGLLLLAAPESGKTSIVMANGAKHVLPIAVITGRSVEVLIGQSPEVEYIAFNDLTAIRALSHEAQMLLITLLNQITQDERGTIAFAGQRPTEITRPLGVIACLPFHTFSHHRARWKEIGFVSRMLPFAYSYPDHLVATIKDSIDHVNGSPRKIRPRTIRKSPVAIRCSSGHTKTIRDLADRKAIKLGQLGLRLLSSYHCLVRAHALRAGRRLVTVNDIDFLVDVDRHISITDCEPLARV